jgi:hypothetical protein
MASERILALIKSHATTDLATLIHYKDELVATICEDNPVAVEAAQATLRIELPPDDLELLAERAQSATDWDIRLSVYAVLSAHNRIKPADLATIGANLGELSDQQQFFLGIIAMHCQLPWHSPIVLTLFKRATSAQGGWHRHVHTLSCLLSYHNQPELFQLAADVQANILHDGLLVAALRRSVAEARKRMEVEEGKGGRSSI